MPDTYFKNFKTIQYGNSTVNNAVVDITERVAMLSNVQKNPYVYYPLDITSGTRADQLAQYNFNDAFASWVIYLNNDIIDPYYDWYLTDLEFNNFIAKKYGSISAAMQQIAFWRNNWAGQNSLTVTAYNAEIANNPGRIGYWEPNYNSAGSVINYTRKQTDWIVNTNQVLNVTYTGLSGSGFIPNEPLIINSMNGNGSGGYVQSNATNVILNNIINTSGNVYSNGLITGSFSNTSARYFFTNQSYVANNISSDVFAYYAPVSYYDYEREKNEGNRTILLMNSNYVPGFVKNVTDGLKQ